MHLGSFLDETFYSTPFDDRIMYPWIWYNNVLCIKLYNVGYVYKWYMYIYISYFTKYKIMHWIIYLLIEMYIYRYTEFLYVITSLHYILIQKQSCPEYGGTLVYQDSAVLHKKVLHVGVLLWRILFYNLLRWS